MLVYRKGAISDAYFRALPDHLSNTTLVFNNTRVIPARLVFYKESGARIEIFCLEPAKGYTHETVFQEKQQAIWHCLVGNSKKWKEGRLLRKLQYRGKDLSLYAERSTDQDGREAVQFSWDQEEYTFGEVLEAAGQTPIPPYLNREAEEQDRSRYQTLYSQHKGSVAAPTAGLHFTPEVLAKLEKKNTESLYLTLHVGIGTFRPVQAETIQEHQMHSELFSLSRDTLLRLLDKSEEGVLAVGTTSTRTLESLFWLGLKMHQQKLYGKPELGQWEAYQLKQNLSLPDSLSVLIEYLDKNNLSHLQGNTRMIIVPSYRYKLVNQLITNFHMPRSTLLMLVAAFIGDDWKKVYAHALNQEFRFLSYGDSSLLIP